MTVPLPEGVITFPEGLPGFEGCVRYVLMRSSRLDPFVCLRAADQADPAFVAIAPQTFAPDYNVPLTEADRAKLRIDADAALLWLVIVNANVTPPTVNLRAPIVINAASMVGTQVLTSVAYPIDYPLPRE